MGDRRLAVVQQNQVADAATAHGLALADFEWSIVPQKLSTYTHSKIVHRPTGAWFEFSGGDSSLWSSWWPEPQMPKASEFHERGWPEQLLTAKRWLSIVAHEHATPDLWALAHEQRAFAAPAGGTWDNSPFTERERADVKLRLQEIGRFLIESRHLQDDAAGRVQAQIAYLQGAVERLGRFDFRSVVVGAIVSLIIESGLDSTAARALWAFAVEQLAHAVRLLQP